MTELSLHAHTEHRRHADAAGSHSGTEGDTAAQYEGPDLSGRAPDALAATLAAEFARRWPRDAQGIDAVQRYALTPPGKLLRPILVVRGALAVGGVLEQVLPAAVGFECAHVGSLMHDDIIDGDTVRRGRPAVHARFGHEYAIVAGNALFFTWFAALTECLERGVPAERITRAVIIQARAGVDICHGVERELVMEGGLGCDVDSYLEMARRKTAVMLAAACRVGAVLAGASDEHVLRLGEFGEHLGLAFQIRDDLLPYDDASAAAIGKPAVSDLRNKRPTVPVLLAHASADGADRAAIEHALTIESDPDVAYARMRELVHRTGAYAAAHRLADRHADLARAALAAVPPSPHIQPLVRLTEPSATHTEPSAARAVSTG